MAYAGAARERGVTVATHTTVTDVRVTGAAVRGVRTDRGTAATGMVVGPVPGIRGFVMAAVCNAHGVSGSACLAEHVLESLQPDPSPYVRSLSPARFAPRSWEWDCARDQAERCHEDHYSLPPQRAG